MLLLVSFFHIAPISIIVMTQFHGRRRYFLRTWSSFDEDDNINKEEKDKDDEQSKAKGKNN